MLKKLTNANKTRDGLYHEEFQYLELISDILKEGEETIVREVQSILHSFGPNPGHVFNLGHGITPDINPDNVEIFIRAVHDFSKEYHKN